jgi:hypothetical protein
MVQTIIAVDSVEIYNSRRVYTIMDMIQELGGVQGLLVDILGIFFFPVSRYMVYLKAISKLFLVHTKNKKNLFKN